MASIALPLKGICVLVSLMPEDWYALPGGFFFCAPILLSNVPLLPCFHSHFCPLLFFFHLKNLFNAFQHLPATDKAVLQSPYTISLGAVESTGRREDTGGSFTSMRAAAIYCALWITAFVMS